MNKSFLLLFIILSIFNILCEISPNKDLIKYTKSEFTNKKVYTRHLRKILEKPNYKYYNEINSTFINENSEVKILGEFIENNKCRPNKWYYIQSNLQTQKRTINGWLNSCDLYEVDTNNSLCYYLATPEYIIGFWLMPGNDNCNKYGECITAGIIEIKNNGILYFSGFFSKNFQSTGRWYLNNGILKIIFINKINKWKKYIKDNYNWAISNYNSSSYKKYNIIEYNYNKCYIIFDMNKSIDISYFGSSFGKICNKEDTYFKYILKYLNVDLK